MNLHLFVDIRGDGLGTQLSHLYVMKDVSYIIKHGALLFGVCSHMLLDTLKEKLLYKHLEARLLSDIY